VPGAAQAVISLVIRRKMVQAQAATDPSAGRLDELQTELDDGPRLRAVWEQQTVHIPDMATESRWPRFAAAAIQAGVGAMLCFQLFVEGDNLGALAALAAGVDLRLGLFAATITVGLALGALGGRGAADDDVTIGTTFSWILGLGVFFLAYYTTHGSTSNGAANVTVLFGSIFGISASAAGIPVRLLGPVFLGILGAAAAEASQVIGALLLFGLLAAPAAAAQRLTTQPWRALWLSPILAVISMWAGLTIAYTAPTLPPSFTIMAVATALYAATLLIGHRRAIVRAG